MKKAMAYRGAKSWNDLPVAGKIRNLMLIVIVQYLNISISQRCRFVAYY